jgi:hypothetical protein
MRSFVPFHSQRITLEERMLQERYLSLLHLDGFQRRPDGRSNFRCPVCGDSERSKRKRRGWFNPDLGLASCFNCSGVWPFEKFLEKVQPGLLGEYRREKSAAFLRARSTPEQDAALRRYRELTTAPVIPEKAQSPATLPAGAVSLISDTEATLYMRRRRLPESLINQCLWVPFGADKKWGGRVLLPLLQGDFLYGYQGRHVGSAQPKYLTEVIPGWPKVWGIYDIDPSRPVLVTEGILDAVFLPNAVAMLGGDLSGAAMAALVNTGAEIRFVYDNWWVDKTALQKSIKAARAGFKVFMWPQVDAKDVNDVVLASNSAIDRVFTDDTAYETGMEALLRLRLAEA